MNSETRNCQNCKQGFTIEPDDFLFYEKIKVPPPTFCPTCRMVRRFLWRNERALYRRKCALCKKDILSMYHPAGPFTVYCDPCWWSDAWDAAEYGKPYDFSKPFFVQFDELQKRVPLPALWGFDNVNCDYANHVGHSKNCYLSMSVVSCEDIYYSTSIDRSRGCFDCDLVADSESCYENTNSVRNHRSIFLARSKECLDSSFLFDCSNCQHCFMSSNLRNRKFVFRNAQLSEGEYRKAVAGIEVGSYSVLSELAKEFGTLKKKSLYKFSNILKSEQATGDDISESKNVRQSYKVQKSENIRYSWRIISTKDSLDVSGCLDCEMIYEAVLAAQTNYGLKFYLQIRGSRDSEYCMHGQNLSNTFGCIGLRDKKFCILNKQYTKEAYEELVPKIIEHMNGMPYVPQVKGEREQVTGEIVYRYGEFFPPEISPFAYNETITQEYFPLAEQEALKEGYRWRNIEERGYRVTRESDRVPDRIADVSAEIVNDILGCEHSGTCNDQCTRAFKITPQELQFYKKMSLPIPRLCPNCRHYRRVRERNPLYLWHRQCVCLSSEALAKEDAYRNTAAHFHGKARCPNEFETPYAPNRPEIVYCETCYQEEVV